MGPRPLAYTVMYLQTKPNEQLKPMIFSDKERIKIARIFHIERYFVIYPHKCILKKIEEKVPGKVGECIFDSQKCKSFQGPKAGPGPRPIFYGSLRSPDFASLRWQNIGKNFWGPPLTKSWIRYWKQFDFSTPTRCDLNYVMEVFVSDCR